MPRSTSNSRRTPTLPTVVASEVSRSFDDTRVIDGLDLSVLPGSIHGLIGPSGSGKTTTVRMLTGFLAPSAGEVKVFGRNPRQHTTAMRQRVGYMPQLGVLYPELSILDNLKFSASLYGVRRSGRRIRAVLDILDMGGTETLRLEQASGGMQRRVALAGALLHRPDLLFLDEPTSGLDPILRQKVWRHLQDLRDLGRTIVVTTQIVSEATMCDTVGLIAQGRLLASGHPNALRHRADGGDVIDIKCAKVISRATLDAVRAHPEVKAATRTGDDASSARLVVDDADSAIPMIDAHLEGLGVELQLAERYVTPFDDVFVKLLENQDA